MKRRGWNHDRGNPKNQTEEVAADSYREGGMGTFPKEMGTPGALFGSDKSNTRAGLTGTTFLHSSFILPQDQRSLINKCYLEFTKRLSSIPLSLLPLAWLSSKNAGPNAVWICTPIAPMQSYEVVNISFGLSKLGLQNCWN